MSEIQSYLQKKKKCMGYKKIQNEPQKLIIQLIDVLGWIQLQYISGRHPSIIVELSGISPTLISTWTRKWEKGMYKNILSNQPIYRLSSLPFNTRFPRLSFGL